MVSNAVCLGEIWPANSSGDSAQSSFDRSGSDLIDPRTGAGGSSHRNWTHQQISFFATPAKYTTPLHLKEWTKPSFFVAVVRLYEDALLRRPDIFFGESTAELTQPLDIAGTGTTMLTRRKRPLLAIGIAIFLLTIILWTNQGPSHWHFKLTPGYDSTSPKKRFQWNNVPIRFPLKKLRSLEESRPAKKLPRVQYAFGAETEAERARRRARRKAVKKAFMRCWKSYRKHAWMKDELAPLSGSYRTTFGGWAATLVDSLDTLAIMGMKPELDEAIAAVGKIDFSSSLDEVINVFETNIRYLGGFLAAYDLVGDERLLKKAVEVGEMLLVAFDTPNHMPLSRWHWEDAANGTRQIASESMVVAELGSFTMEFARLSQLTGDMRWYDLVARIMDIFAKQASSTSIPGIWPVGVNPNRLILNSETSFGFGAMEDSLYEYFPKVYALLGGHDALYKKLYKDSMDAGIQNLFFRPMTPDNLDILISGNARSYGAGKSTLIPELQHLSCFTGGMLALGGKLFQNTEHVSIGKKLTEGCVWAYNATSNDVMPEIAYVVPCESTTECTWNQTAWHEAVAEKQFIVKGKDVEDVIEEKRLPPGFTDIGDRSYMLRPEAIESVFILYRITGDKYLLDAAWNMFLAIQRITKTKYANAAVQDVTAPINEIKRRDVMESFWLGETLKYFYLIFCDPDVVSLDDYVFNTEAHPFLRPR